MNKLRDECKLTPGVPLKPMLAKPTKAIGEVLDRFEGKRFTCEYKYDGERAQVHKFPDGTVGVFSRNSEDMSKKYPDLVEQLPHVRSPFCMEGCPSQIDTVHQREYQIVRVGRGSCGNR
jgi:DNA ligase 1